MKIVQLDWPGPDAERLGVERRVLGPMGAEFAVVEGMPEAQRWPLIEEADIILQTHEPMPAAMFARLKRCRLVAHYGIGYDMIDTAAATAHGVLVTNTPTYCLQEVADHTMALVLTLVRRVMHADRAVRQGAWGYRVIAPAARLGTLTLGIVGLGNIGRQVAHRARAFGFRLLAHDPYLPPPAFAEHGTEAADLDALLAHSDIVTVHVPLTAQTRHLISTERLRRMKRTAVLVNTSRGDTVDNAALAAALKEGRIAGAALDVLDREPPPSDHPLLALPNVIVTGHVAYYSEEARVAQAEEACAQVLALLRGETPPALVNREALEKR